MHYTASALYDGTVMAAYPMRKPTPHVIKRDRLRIDADGVAVEYSRGGEELADGRYEGRVRFQDIIASNLNTRRAIRELLLPVLADMRGEIASLRAEVADLKRSLAEDA
jgi:hypothetical protein